MSPRIMGLNALVMEKFLPKDSTKFILSYIHYHVKIFLDSMSELNVNNLTYDVLIKDILKIFSLALP